MIDFDELAAIDWLAVNQFSVVENRFLRRPEAVVNFVSTRVWERME